MTSDRSEPKTVRRVANYLGGNVALARAIHQNALDAAAVHDGEQICYFVDANIVRWYLNPLENFRLVSSLLNPDAPSLLGEIEFACNVIAAEYVFSRLLSGSQGFPPYLTPFHADELFEFLDREIDKLVMEGDKAFDVQSLQDSASALEEAIEGLSSDSASAIPRIFVAFQTILKQTYSQVGFRTTRVRDLFENGRVVRSDEYGDFQLDDKYRTGTPLKRWRDALAAAGKVRTEEKKLRRDAESLCMLEQLNYDAARDNRPIRFVLLSSDETLHNAVDRWRNEQKLIGVNRFDFARHPRQYLPIINLNAMRAHADERIPGFSELMDSANDIRFSISKQMGSGSPEVANASHSPERVALSIRRSIKRSQLLRFADRIDQMSKRWRNALELSILMNTRVIQCTAGDYLKWSISHLTQIQVDEELRRGIAEDIEQISIGHIEFAARTQLHALSRQLRQIAGLGSEERKLRSEARSHLFVRIQLPEPLRTLQRDWGEETFHSLGGFIDHLVANTHTGGMADFEEAVAKVRGVETAKLVSALAFRLGQWEQARYFCDRCAHHIGESDPELHEFHFLRIAADRFFGLSLDDLQRNRRLLEHQIGVAARQADWFGFVRGLSEAAAQCLFFAYSQTLPPQEERRAPAVYLTRLVRDAESYLDRARRCRELWRAPPGTAGAEAPMIRALRIQVLANSLSAFFFTALGAMSQEDNPDHDQQPDRITRIVDELCGMVQSDAKLFRLEEYYVLCGKQYIRRMAKRDGRRPPTELDGRRVRQLINAFNRSRQTFQDLDRREFEWLTDVLEMGAHTA